MDIVQHHVRRDVETEVGALPAGGAQGEGGPATRTPELPTTSLLEGGTTTAVGCLGADGVTRTLSALLMKAKGLRQEGVSA